MTSSNSSRIRPAVNLLRELQQHPMTLSELQQAINLSRPTVHRSLKELQAVELVTEAGRRESTGGRRATLYSLNGKAKLVVGVHLQLPGMHLVLTNLTGAVICHHYVSGDYDAQANRAVQEIVHFVQHVTERYGIERLIGIGIASPGYLDKSGAILSIGRDPSWQNVLLAARLQQELGLPALVENDVNCMAQAEMVLDHDTAEQDFLYLGFTEGVKATLVLNGEFYGGPYGNAGSIGHSTVDLNGPICQCGNRGCLETRASVRSLHAAFEDRLASLSAPSDQLVEIGAISDRIERFHAIMAAAEAGEPICREIVTDALFYLAIAIANLVNIFQVRLFLVGGELSRLPRALRRYLDDTVRNRLVPLLNQNLIIRYTQDSREHNAAVGAAIRFIDHHLATMIEQELTLS